VIKTRAGRLGALASVLAEHHPYQLPENVALRPSEVEPRYLAWLLGETGEA
jgi:periplasmic divalent cation tolerance protein